MRTYDDTAVLDVDQLRNACMDDPELMRELVAALIDDAREHIAELEQTIEHADAAACARVAHYVKGACANLGAASMAAILKNIERDAAQGDLCACRNSLDNLSAELQKFCSQAASI